MRALSKPFKRAPEVHAPVVIERSEHNISRKQISTAALKVLYRLKSEGFDAYLVGGGVRDLLLGESPKDFDIATNAKPEQVRGLFKNSRMIGRRFVIVHVVFGREIIEVTTFRAPPRPRDIDPDGRIRSDNNYGDIASDAARRDFSINALYYNIADFSVTDFFGGLQAIKDKKIRFIGDPATRYQEDPVRGLRALRFAAKLGFELDDDAFEALSFARDNLEQIPAARLYEEAMKLFLSGHGEASLDALLDGDLLFTLFPTVDERLQDHEEQFEAFIRATLVNTDQRVQEGRSVQPGFLFAAFLWADVKDRADDIAPGGHTQVQAVLSAADIILAQQTKYTACPKRFTQPAIDVWVLQARMATARGKRVERIVEHPKFRAAVDFLKLRDAVGEDHGLDLQYWVELADQIPPAPVRQRRFDDDEQGERPRRRSNQRRRGKKTPE
ncbi:MAG: polynucleotide adenylyltransferase PcnB [Gammaproteobacteria bacterium]|nr:polynucleotide adenylyltransferase PcnB [Gammaproteobacteria bacterium]